MTNDNEEILELNVRKFYNDVDLPEIIVSSDYHSDIDDIAIREGVKAFYREYKKYVLETPYVNYKITGDE